MAEGANPQVIFLLGAGASVSAGIPAVKEMTERFLAKLDPNMRALALSLFGKIKSHKEENFDFTESDIEDLLFILNQLLSLPQNSLSGFVALKHRYSESKLQKLKKSLETYIRRTVISPKDVSYLGPLLSERWQSSIHIFSVNYDTCVELLCRKHGRRVTDGFTPEWNPQALNPSTAPEKSVFLYKLHGSALWYKSTGGWYVKIPLGVTDAEDDALPLYDGEKATPALLYPMYKQPQESPLLDFIYTFKRYLETASSLIVVGYSFRDDYLNLLIRDALLANPKLHIFSIAPNAHDSYGGLLAKPDKSFRLAFEGRLTCLPFVAERYLEKFKEQFVGLNSAVREYYVAKNSALTGEHPNWEHVGINLAREWDPVLSLQAFNEHGSPRRTFDLAAILTASLTNYCVALSLGGKEIIVRAEQRLDLVSTTLWRSISVRLSGEGGGRFLHFSLNTMSGNQVPPSSITQTCQNFSKFLNELGNYMLRSNVPEEDFDSVEKKIQGIRLLFENIGRRDRFSFEEGAEIIPNGSALLKWAQDISSGKSAQEINALQPTPISSINAIPQPIFMTFNAKRKSS